MMIGCAVALFGAEHLRTLARLWPVALTIIVTYFGSVDWESNIPYDGGLFVFSFSAAILIAKLLMDPGSHIGRVFSNAILVWIGKISYGLYLWHYLIFKLLPHMSRLHTTITVFTLSFACAALMFSFVEKPILEMRNKTLPVSLKFAIASTSISLLAVGLALLATRSTLEFAASNR
jgi:peptidoglycan/LPS O-acetylase OafA/YrhL